MSGSYFWTNILALATGTLIIRGSMIFLLAKARFSETTREILSYVPSAVFPAIIAPAILLHQGHVDWLAGKERIPAALLTIAVFLVTRSPLGSLVAGIALLSILS